MFINELFHEFQTSRERPISPTPTWEPASASEAGRGTRAGRVEEDGPVRAGEHGHAAQAARGTPAFAGLREIQLRPRQVAPQASCGDSLSQLQGESGRLGPRAGETWESGAVAWVVPSPGVLGSVVF